MSNSKEQLREAYTLMKAGQKKEAGAIVQTILQQDKQNVDAWWLLANLVDDTDKRITCVEQVLKLQPDHAGANQLLDQLRPMDDLFAEAAADLNAGVMPAKKKSFERRASVSTSQRLVTYAVIASIVIFVGVLGFALLGGFNVSGGNTPVEAMVFFMRAVGDKDFDAMRSLTCADSHAEIAEFQTTISENPAFEDMRFDVSGLAYNVDAQTADHAAVLVAGDVGLVSPFLNVELEFDNFASQMLRLSFLDMPINVRQDNGRWYLCNDRSQT